MSVFRGNDDGKITTLRTRYTNPASRMDVPVQPQDPSEITRQLVELRIEHRDLDAAIAALVADLHSDELRLKRMKVRKLRLKDMISYLESKLIPDLDA
jgi:hypothetical protein